MSYAANKKAAIYIDNTPSLTDQGGAKDTDINVIVKRFARTGTVPKGNGEAMAGDFENTPTDLRGYIERAREVEKLRKRLPKELQDMPAEQFMALTNADLKRILTPKPTHKPSEEEKK